MYVPSHLAPLALAQNGVATRAQLNRHGCGTFEIRAQLAARRWSAWGSHVILFHNTEPSRRQLMWAAVLDAGHTAALGSHTALELAGFRPFATESARIHLIIERGTRVCAHPEIQVHESRRVHPLRHVITAGLPTTSIPRSCLDAAAWQPWPRLACVMVAAVVQQRLCSADDLEQTMREVGRIRHKRWLRETIREVAGGSESLPEVDFLRICRRFGLADPDRQVRRRDAAGRIRYLDAEWRLADGRRVVLEIDGAHHLDAGQWAADMVRQRGLTVTGATLVRTTSVELRVDPGSLVRDLLALGVPELSDAS